MKHLVLKRDPERESIAYEAIESVFPVSSVNEAYDLTVIFLAERVDSVTWMECDECLEHRDA